MKKTKKLDQNTVTIIFIVVCVAFCAWCVISSIVDGVKSDIEKNGIQTPEAVEDVVNNFGVIGEVAEEIEKQVNSADVDKIVDSIEPTSETIGD